MIDRRDIHRVLSNIIVTVTVTGLDPRMVIRLCRTGSKPKELFAGLDVLAVRECFEHGACNDVMGEVKYENILVRLSVHNGNPEDRRDVKGAQTLCESLRQAFFDEAVAEYLDDQLSAKVTIENVVRPVFDDHANGYGAAGFFSITLRVKV